MGGPPSKGARASKEPASGDRNGREFASSSPGGVTLSQLVPLPVGHVENPPHAVAMLDDSASEIQNDWRFREP
jgi:hypothetical protein